MSIVSVNVRWPRGPPLTQQATGGIVVPTTSAQRVAISSSLAGRQVIESNHLVALIQMVENLPRRLAECGEI